MTVGNATTTFTFFLQKYLVAFLYTWNIGHGSGTDLLSEQYLFRSGIEKGEREGEVDLEGWSLRFVEWPPPWNSPLHRPHKLQASVNLLWRPKILSDGESGRVLRGVCSEPLRIILPSMVSLTLSFLDSLK